MIETRNGSSRVLSQQVWGLTYVDELLQTAMNQDPGDTTEGSGGRCERYFYILQDANFNVLGSADANGTLIERYEYTPYGQRTVYSHDWIITDVNDDGVVDVNDMTAITNSLGQDCPPASDRKDPAPNGEVDVSDYIKVVNDLGQKDARVNDPLVSHPRLDSAGGLDDTDRILPLGVCDFGHQGLLHDKEFGLIYNRARYLHPRLGRFTTRDPIGYADGMSLYQYVGSRTSVALDPMGSYYIWYPTEGSAAGTANYRSSWYNSNQLILP